MPGKQVKNWKTYHGLRKSGASKTKAARIANAGKSAQRKGGKRSSRRK
jgi:hypothetical protein